MDRPFGTSPAWVDSRIGTQSVLFALGVLAVALLTLRKVSRRDGSPDAVPVLPRAEAGPREPVRRVDPADVTLFLVGLGEAMLDAGAPVTLVHSTLESVAERYGVPGTETVVLSTALIVSVPGSGPVHTAVATAGGRALRLDQIDEVFDVVEAAATGNIIPSAGLARIASIRAMPPPWPRRVRLLGHVVLSMGLVLILGGNAVELVVGGLLGMAVGALQLSGGSATAYRTTLPVVCSFGVAVVVFLLARTGADIGVFAPLIAPLVTFLPGALLTTAVIELSTGQMISGAGRLAAGGMQLVLLAVGIVAAAQAIGVPTTSVLDTAVGGFGAGAPWLGVAVFAIGIVLYNCARPSALPWILLVLYVAYAAQVLGGLFFGGVLSAFVGAAIMTPVAMMVALHPSGPVTLVTFLPAFWLLVPGALGLVGAAKYLGEGQAYGFTSLVTAGATMVAIALGILMGISLGRSVIRARV